MEPQVENKIRVRLSGFPMLRVCNTVTGKEIRLKKLAAIRNGFRLQIILRGVK